MKIATVCKKSALRVLMRLRRIVDYKKVSRSWRIWREFVMKQHVDFSKALAANPQGLLDKAVADEEVKMKMHFTRKAATRVIRRWSQAKAWDAFLKWKIWNEKMLWNETKGIKVLRILDRMIGNRVNNRLKVFWWTWKLHSERVGRRRRDRKYGSRMVMIILKDDIGKKAAKAFIKWKDWTVEDRNLERVKGANTAKFLDLVGAAIKKMTKDSLWCRFVIWKMKVSQVGKYNRGISVVWRMMKRDESRMVLKGWRAWVEVCTFEIRKAKVLRSTILRMQKNSKATGWAVLKRQCAHARFQDQKKKFKRETQEVSVCMYACVAKQRARRARLSGDVLILLFAVEGQELPCVECEDREDGGDVEVEAAHGVGQEEGGGGEEGSTLGYEVVGWIIESGI